MRDKVFLYVTDLDMQTLDTVCPTCFDPFYIAIYYLQWVKTPQTYSIKFTEKVRKRLLGQNK